MQIEIKNWSSLQSYKDRRPPWIRLHKTILDDFEFHSMSVGARALLPMIWLLASEDTDPVSGMIRYGYNKIAFRLRLPENEVKKSCEELEKTGFIGLLQDEGDSVTQTLQDGNETVTPEKRREEIEKRQRRKRTLSESEKKRMKVDVNTDLMNRIGDWFGRKSTTLWTISEGECLDQLGVLSDDELETMRFFYEANIPEASDYRRRTIGTLLNNWNSELDKAIEYKRINQKRKPKLVF
jgi:hypothetical protein